MVTRLEIVLCTSYIIEHWWKFIKLTITKHTQVHKYLLNTEKCSFPARGKQTVTSSILIIQMTHYKINVELRTLRHDSDKCQFDPK